MPTKVFQVTVPGLIYEDVLVDLRVVAEDLQRVVPVGALANAEDNWWIGIDMGIGIPKADAHILIQEEPSDDSLAGRIGLYLKAAKWQVISLRADSLPAEHEQLLKQAVDEMERRFGVMEETGANISSEPPLAVVFDGAAPLRNDIGRLGDLARIGRAANIRVIIGVAPSARWVNGELGSNITVHIKNA